MPSPFMLGMLCRSGFGRRHGRPGPSALRVVAVGFGFLVLANTVPMIAGSWRWCSAGAALLLVRPVGQCYVTVALQLAGGSARTPRRWLRSQYGRTHDSGTGSSSSSPGISHS